MKNKINHQNNVLIFRKIIIIKWVTDDQNIEKPIDDKSTVTATVTATVWPP